MTEKPEDHAIKHERLKLLTHFTALTNKIMVVLSLVWIGLMIVQFTGNLDRPLIILNYVIWFIFIADFLIKFTIAPHKRQFLRSHWIGIISLILPAFGVMRIFQTLRLLRMISLLRILTSFNRSMRELNVAMGRRGVGYVLALTLLVLFSGAAGMYAFENPSQLAREGYVHIVQQGGGLKSYSDAVWWTAMLMTTIGSQYWPVTEAGRLLCFLISLFSLGVFGYITATLASFFVDTKSDKDSASDLKEVAEEIRALRAEIRSLSSLKRKMD